MTISFLSYVVAFFIVLATDWFGILAFALAGSTVQGRKKLGVATRFIADGLASFLSVWLVSLVAHWTLLRASTAMILLPAILILLNDWKRIVKTSRGESAVREMFESNGNAHLYDLEWDLLMKKAALYGHLTGLATGIFEVLGKAPLF